LRKIGISFAAKAPTIPYVIVYVSGKTLLVVHNGGYPCFG